MLRKYNKDIEKPPSWFAWNWRIFLDGRLSVPKLRKTQTNWKKLFTIQRWYISEWEKRKQRSHSMLGERERFGDLSYRRLWFLLPSHSCFCYLLTRKMEELSRLSLPIYLLTGQFCYLSPDFHSFVKTSNWLSCCNFLDTDFFNLISISYYLSEIRWWRGVNQMCSDLTS